MNDELKNTSTPSSSSNQATTTDSPNTNTLGYETTQKTTNAPSPTNLTLTNSFSDSALSSLPTRRPDSPFLRPSTPEPITQTSTTLTPNQTRIRIQREHLLRTGSSKRTDVPPSKSSLIGTYANLVNTIVGAGIIGIPYALKESGLVTGLCLIAVVAVLTDKSLRMLIETGRKVNATSYERLMEAVFGRVGFVFISMNMLIMSYGAMVCYLLIIKDTFPTLLGFGREDVWARRQILIVSSFIVILPLSMQRDMADLDKTSILSVAFDIIMVLIVAIFAPIRENIQSTAGGLPELISESTIHPRTLFVGLGVLSFAFVCQDSSFIIAESLDNPTKERWATVTRTSLLTCSLLAAIIGISGFLGFQDATEGNVLNNFSTTTTINNEYTWMKTSTAASTARVLLGTTMFFVYPLASYIARHALIVLLFRGSTAHEGDDHTVLARRDRRIILTVVLYLSALIPSLMFDNVGTVLAVTGAVAGSSLSYLGPGAAYIGIHGELFLKMVGEGWWWGGCRVGKWMWGFPSVSGSVCGDEGGERTPLVGVGVSLDGMRSKDLGDENAGGSCCRSIFHICSWYILWMPLWCSIATRGVNSLKEEALKTPMSNRLGKVVRYYKHNPNARENNAVTNGGGNSNSRELRPQWGRSNSGDLKNSSIVSNNNLPSSYDAIRVIPPATQCNAPNSDPSSKYNGTIIRPIVLGGGTVTTDMQLSQRSNDMQDLGGEEKTQDAPPQWSNFILAGVYIIIGIIALCAGLISISVS